LRLRRRGNFHLTEPAAAAQWAHMPTPTLEKLLVLQERDQHRLSLESQLRAVPRDVAAVEQLIATEKAAIAAARGELQELEVKKKAVETDVGTAEDRLTKYKSQQLLVRKNDEYQALSVEIGHTQAQIDALEEEELKAMYAIDEAKRKFAAAEAALKQNIAGHESRIRLLGERETSLQAELCEAQAAVAAARSLLDEPTLRAYDRLVTKPGHPVVVPIHEGKCGGCHLKISFNVDSETRKPDKLVTCDQCGRIVYWEA
jgi:predicted  nucleic acid-binding Zn-ribbon protein